VPIQNFYLRTLHNGLCTTWNSFYSQLHWQNKALDTTVSEYISKYFNSPTAAIGHYWMLLIIIINTQFSNSHSPIPLMIFNPLSTS